SRDAVRRVSENRGSCCCRRVRGTLRKLRSLSPCRRRDLLPTNWRRYLPSQTRQRASDIADSSFHFRREAGLGVIGGHIGHVLVRKRRRDGAHRRVVALAGLVFVERVDEVLLVLVGDARDVVDFGTGRVPYFGVVTV